MRLLEVILMTLAGLWQGVRQDLNLLEIALIAAAYWFWFRKGKTLAFHWPLFSQKPWLLAVGIALGVVLLRLALIPLMPVPVPIVTDEFSHLLLADTLLHGRLANPTHPYWPHFESLHIIQQPHYVSNYFPGQAVWLAAGLWLLHSAWSAVLAECALFLVALYWALRGWMPARWALFGTLLVALRFGIASYWVNAYHGGFLPALGGALIAGAFPRLRRRVTLENSFALALGLAILASTRPYEGLAFSVPFVAVLVWETRRHFAKLVLLSAPVLLMVGVTLFGLATYFRAVTGSPVKTAYQISYRTYGWPMSFPWTPVQPNKHRHVELQRYYEYEVSEHEKVDGPIDFVEYLTFRIQEYWRFFLGPFLTIPLIMLRHVWRRRPMLFAGIAGAGAAVLLEGASTPHYISPATVMIVAVVVECCRYLNASRLRGVVALLPAGMALVLVLRVVTQTAHLPYTQKLNYQSWCCRVQGDLTKARFTKEMLAMPGDHLVFVKTKTDELNLFQWIYNLADIDHQRIIWARDLGEERNAQLLHYYAEQHLAKTVWLVDPNVTPASYGPYSLTPKSILQSQTRLPLPSLR